MAAILDGAQVVVGPSHPGGDPPHRGAARPATGCEVEPELVEMVASDMAAEPSALPLLSAALAEVWERRDGNVACRARQRTSSSAGSPSLVARLGQRVLDWLGPARRTEVRRTLLDLVDVTPDGVWFRRRVRADPTRPTDGRSSRPSSTRASCTSSATRSSSPTTWCSGPGPSSGPGWPRPASTAWLTASSPTQRERRTPPDDRPTTSTGEAGSNWPRPGSTRRDDVDVDPLVARSCGPAPRWPRSRRPPAAARLEREIRTRRRVGSAPRCHRGAARRRPHRRRAGRRQRSPSERCPGRGRADPRPAAGRASGG